MANPKQERNAARRHENKSRHQPSFVDYIMGAGRERNIGHPNAEEHNRSGQHKNRPTGPRKK